MKPLALDLFCGLGGWSDGLLAEGYDCIGFDIERHDYGTGGYPGQLVIQDVTTIDGAQFKDAAVIVASPPCQEFSHMAMPWSRAKHIERALLEEVDWFPDGYKGSRTTAELTRLFDACFRIQREASEAAGRHIPMVVENVRGAQKWVGRARANFGSYYLWGDVGMVGRRVVAGPSLDFGFGVAPRKAAKVPGFRFDGSGGSFQTASVEKQQRGAKTPAGNCSAVLWKDREIARYAHPTPEEMEAQGFGDAVKAPGMNWSDQTRRGQDFTRLAGQHAVKGFTPDGERMGKNKGPRLHASKSSARKAASAMIAKIPFALSRYIAQAYKPATQRSISC